MSWQDEARANAYLQAGLNANNDRELERNMQAADQAVDMIGNVVNGIGKALTEPSPPPKSSGVGLGGLLVLGALAGGAYLLSKAFGSDDKPQSTNSFNNDSSSKKSDYPETEC